MEERSHLLSLTLKAIILIDLCLCFVGFHFFNCEFIQAQVFPFLVSFYCQFEQQEQFILYLLFSLLQQPLEFLFSLKKELYLKVFK